jgi:hypothetical protein
LHRRPFPPIVWSPCFPRTIQLPLAASPCGRLSRPRSTTSQSDFRRVIRSSSLCQLVGPYKRCLNSTDLPCSHEFLRPHAGGTNPGSIPRTLAITHPGILPSPLRDKIGCFDHDRFRGYVSVHCCSGLLPPCLRFVMLVTDHHARLGTRLRAKLYRGRHLRRLDSMSFQGATPTPPYVRNRIRRFGGLCIPSRKPGKTEVIEVSIANREVYMFRTAGPP